MDMYWNKYFYNQMCCKHYYWCPPKSLSGPVVLVFNYFWLQWHLQRRHSLGFCSSGVRCLKEMDRNSPVLSSLFLFYLPHFLYSLFGFCFPFNFWWCSFHLLNTSHLYATLDVIPGLQSSCPTICTSLKINSSGYLSKTLITTIFFS